MNNMMTFPKTIDEFIESYQFVDRKEVYTNGSELIQVFRVQQAIEHYLPKWISVKERLPEHFQRVLVCDANGSISIALRDHYLDMFVTEDGYDTVQPKWWMQLPESPEV